MIIEKKNNKIVLILMPITVYMFLGTGLFFLLYQIEKIINKLGSYSKFPYISKFPVTQWHNASPTLTALFPVTIPLISIWVFLFLMYSMISALINPLLYISGSQWLWSRIIVIWVSVRKPYNRERIALKDLQKSQIKSYKKKIKKIDDDIHDSIEIEAITSFADKKFDFKVSKDAKTNDILSFEQKDSGFKKKLNNEKIYDKSESIDYKEKIKDNILKPEKKVYEDKTKDYDLLENDLDLDYNDDEEIDDSKIKQNDDKPAFLIKDEKDYDVENKKKEFKNAFLIEPGTNELDIEDKENKKSGFKKFLIILLSLILIILFYILYKDFISENNNFLSNYISIFNNQKINTYKFSDGVIYNGSIVNGKMNGVGTLSFPDGTKYNGQFKDDKMNGEGTIIYGDKTNYTGQFKNGKMEGKGTLAFPNGSKYIGEFVDDKIHGKGTLTYSDGTVYIGDFKDDKMDGSGVIKYPDGTEYLGQFKSDKMHGKGEIIYSDGTSFKGNFINGIKQ